MNEVGIGVDGEDIKGFAEDPVEKVRQLERALAEKEKQLAETTAELNKTKAFINELFRILPKPIYIYFIDRDGKLRYVNDATLHYLKKDRDEVIGRKPSELFFEESGKTLAEAGKKTIIETSLEKGGVVVEGAESKLISHVGTTHILTSCAPVRVDGELVGMVGYFVDISPIKQKEEEARKAFKLVEEVFRKMPFPAYVIYVNTDHKIQYANDEIAKLAGFNRAEEIVGKHPSELFQTEGGRTIADKVLDTGKAVINYQAVTRTKTGREVPVLVSCVPVHVDGEMVGVIDLFTDITELKEKEAEIMKTLEYTDRALELLTVGIRELQSGNLGARVEKPEKIEGVKVARRFEETVDIFNEFAERLNEIVRRLAEDMKETAEQVREANEAVNQMNAGMQQISSASQQIATGS
ncbi:PAS domain-containing protein, partial [Archaeoglobus neptunius]|uniref:PAS domain-containing protein n=1 Tax=Archaeoglobus neptunius TaxID=2798580 RepID=UPI0019296012